MSELNKLIEEIMHDQRERTHTVILAKIEKYDHVEMKADLQPLIKEEYAEPTELALIKNASIACPKVGQDTGKEHLIRPPYKVGDVVLAVCVDRSIDEVIESGDVSEQVGHRRHSLQDAIVIAGVTVEPKPMPDEHAEDMLMCKWDGGDILTKIVLTDQKEEIQIVKLVGGDPRSRIILKDNEDIEVHTKTQNISIAKMDLSAEIKIFENNDIELRTDADIRLIAAGDIYINGKTVNING